MTSNDWGRVADDGTVYVKTADGEREVGQMPDATAEEALAFYTQRYDNLALEVDLLTKRVNSGVVSPDEAAKAIELVRSQIEDAHAVGDLAALSAKLDLLGPVLATQRANRREEKQRRTTEAKQEKEKLAAEAEQIATGKDWRNGANRFRDLLEQWKQLPRIDKASDDALWKRFSSARSAYTKARKAHFAEMDQKRDQAKAVKERLCVEAEALSGSTDWGPTSRKYRDLMQEWKAAGPAPRNVEEKLWKRFRGAQDVFFGARDEANAQLDQEYAANAEVKEQILVEAEALLPVTDVAAAKRSFREIAERWDEAGKVPRARIKELEGRMRAVEQAIRKVEDEKWDSSDPEKSARADDMVGQLQAAIADLETKLDKARSAGDDKAVRRLEDDLAGRRTFLEMAQKAASDFS
ncbi:DUF349 domain-containing protein [Nocardioides panacisoli]|uniref:DUF349 domain-containing protein n=1 Tax=Nocardioides panacisoli TaxID=627624 RepID=UPI001C62A987|nr:DUF349 domain-containing protein [Nocardioides panacisoli]QYJ05218.1 DUF349 domain-containing protein [Nocardioides panacisoli]